QIERAQNPGSCCVCPPNLLMNQETIHYWKVTSLAMKKLVENGFKLAESDKTRYLCHLCYNPKKFKSILYYYGKALTDALYDYQHQQHKDVLYDPKEFVVTLNNYNSNLKSFFDAIVEMTNLKRKIVGICYELAGMYNKFVNLMKIDADISLMTIGTLKQGIDALATLGVTASYKRMPNVTSLHTINHMATICVNLSKHYMPIPYYSLSGYNIHNPEFIDANIIISKLQIANLPDNMLIDSLTVHIYDSDIVECKEERVMKDVKLVDLIPLELHSIDAYLKTINTYTQLQSIKQYLDLFIVSVPADFPEQLYICHAIVHKLMLGNQTSIPDEILQFISILEPLHYQLKQLEEISVEFLLSLFIDIRNKDGQNKITTSKKCSKCFLAAFNTDVDIKWLPTGYHVLKKPSKDKFCNTTKYRLKFGINKNEIIEPNNNEIEVEDDNEVEDNNGVEDNNKIEDNISQIEIDSNISNCLDAALRLF
ncbi:651_t:CDS:2, partial [Dentiscutata erythropus]